MSGVGETAWRSKHRGKPGGPAGMQQRVAAPTGARGRGGRGRGGRERGDRERGDRGRGDRGRGGRGRGDCEKKTPARRMGRGRGGAPITKDSISAAMPGKSTRAPFISAVVRVPRLEVSSLLNTARTSAISFSVRCSAITWNKANHTKSTQSHAPRKNPPPPHTHTHEEECLGRGSV